MAVICPYSKPNCQTCAHFRPDPDRDGRKSCWLAFDQKTAAANAPAAPEQKSSAADTPAGPEKITAAAIVFRLADGTNHTCTGTHHSVIWSNFQAYRKNHKLKAIKSTEYGFLTDTGRFLSRTEAMALARINGQLKSLTERTELESICYMHQASKARRGIQKGGGGGGIPYAAAVYRSSLKKVRQQQS